LDPGREPESEEGSLDWKVLRKKGPESRDAGGGYDDVLFDAGGSLLETGG